MTKDIDYATLYTRVCNALDRNIYFTVSVTTSRHSDASGAHEPKTDWCVYVAWDKDSGGNFYHGRTALDAYAAFTADLNRDHRETLVETSALVGTGEVRA